MLYEFRKLNKYIEDFMKIFVDFQINTKTSISRRNQSLDDVMHHEQNNETQSTNKNTHEK